MVNASKNLYCPGMSPQALAAKVLNDRFGEGMPSLPIDPFKLMREYGIVYQLMAFENLEGIYLVPEGENDLPVVGINYKRKITRQRFTAAHELCHHLKDRRSEICPKGAMEARRSGLRNSSRRNCLCQGNCFYLSRGSMKWMGRFHLMMRCRSQNVSV